MKAKTKAILGGLAFVAGCEIGIAIQIYKMGKKYAIEEAARKAEPDNTPDALDEAAEELDNWTEVDDWTEVPETEETEADVYSELPNAQPDPVPGV